MSAYGSSAQDVGKNIQKLSKLIKELQRLEKNIGTSQDTARNRQILGTKRREARTLTKTLESDLANGSESLGVKYNKLNNAFSKSKESFYDLDEKLNKSLKRYSTAFESDFGGGTTDDEKRSPIGGGLQSQQQTDMFREYDENLDYDNKMRAAERRKQDVEYINKEVQSIHDMQQDMNELVREQGEEIDVMEEQVETARDNIEVAAKDIDRA